MWPRTLTEFSALRRRRASPCFPSGRNLTTGLIKAVSSSPSLRGRLGYTAGSWLLLGRCRARGPGAPTLHLHEGPRETQQAESEVTESVTSHARLDRKATLKLVVHTAGLPLPPRSWIWILLLCSERKSRAAEASLPQRGAPQQLRGGAETQERGLIARSHSSARGERGRCLVAELSHTGERARGRHNLQLQTPF